LFDLTVLADRRLALKDRPDEPAYDDMEADVQELLDAVQTCDGWGFFVLEEADRKVFELVYQNSEDIDKIIEAIKIVNEVVDDMINLSYWEC